VVLSIPDDFEDRFLAFVANVNAVNVDRGTPNPPIKIEKMYNEKPPPVAAFPKNMNKKGEVIEDKD